MEKSQAPSRPLMGDWLQAFRLRTLPLAFSSILMGSFLALAEQNFSIAIFLLALLTTLCLQVLSNLANDYGDSIHGADHADRKGPARMVQSGRISHKLMKKAIYFFGLLSLISGLSLLWLAFSQEVILLLLFLSLGLTAIWAAYNYTAGSKPYGYEGLGDIFVFLFFGWVGVLGVYFLHTQHFDPWILLPASSVGLFATGVLNVNNLRDIESDQKAGKKSLPVRMGYRWGIGYHILLILGGWLLALVYLYFNFSALSNLLFLLTLPLFTRHLYRLMNTAESYQLDPLLKQLAIATFLFSILFGLGQWDFIPFFYRFT